MIKKIPVICPYCRNELMVGDLGWAGIWEDLQHFGKSIKWCPTCKSLFIIREEDEDGPFITK